MNYGNTGQRFKMSKFASVEKQDDGMLLVTLTCGHSFSVPDGWDGAFDLFQQFVAQGKKTRCNDCEVKR